MAASVHEEVAIRAERHAAEMGAFPTQAENARRTAQRERKLAAMLRRAAVSERQRGRVYR
jgi:hypothetical protein